MFPQRNTNTPKSVSLTDGHGKRFTVKLKEGATEGQARSLIADLVKAGAQRIGSRIHY